MLGSLMVPMRIVFGGPIRSVPEESWRVVAGLPQSRWGWLYGCEGERLVTRSRAAVDGATELDFWIPQASAK